MLHKSFLEDQLEPVNHPLNLKRACKDIFVSLAIVAFAYFVLREFSSCKPPIPNYRDYPIGTEYNAYC